ncbi:MAG: hypothetical protein QXE18_07190 [Thermoplasmata archaeon]
MSAPLSGILASSTVPPWLPRDAQEARKFAFWSQVLFLLMAFIWFVLGIASIAIGIASLSGGSVGWGLFDIIMAIICGIAGIYVKKSVIDEIDHGRFMEAKNASIVWIIIGIAGLFLPSILMLLAFMSIDAAMRPQVQVAPYPPGTVVAQQPYQPAQYQQPAQPQYQPAQYQPAQYQAPQTAAPATVQAGPQPSDQHKYQMVKCKNCNVQYPAFMANCPNCGAPRA